jgi:pyruvate carboxylase
VNPRIQVEHTVTEVVTGIDIVRSQILVAQGYKLHETPVHIPKAGQDRNQRLRDPVPHHDRRPINNFIPDYGRISTYRSAGGFRAAAGRRATVSAGASSRRSSTRCW